VAELSRFYGVGLRELEELRWIEFRVFRAYAYARLRASDPERGE
jgi:hypothetical protein